MAEKRVIAMGTITAFFDQRQLIRGENSYCSNNVVRALFDSEVRPALLKGEVKSSMKYKNYSVEISLHPVDGIVGATCSCPRGQVICHHMSALCYFGHYNFSVTDKECVWSAPKKREAEDENLPSGRELYPERKHTVCEPTPQSERNRFEGLLGGPVGFSWHMKPEPTMECLTVIPTIEDIIFTTEYLEAEDKENYFQSKARISEETIQKVANATKGQHKNENWLVCRKHRLTASRFGAIISACTKNRYPPSLFKSLLEGYDLEKIKAIQWGRDNEKEALDMFKLGLKMEVKSTGLWLDECGFLGASPDGLVGDDAIIEIKCPYKYRDYDLEEVLKVDQKYIIKKTETGATVINKNHPYWDQIQGQLHITKRKICYLTVWTPNKMEVIMVERCHDWAPNLELLKEFYLRKYLPEIFFNL